MSFELYTSDSGNIEVIVPGTIGPAVITTTINTSLLPGHNVINHNKQIKPRFIQLYDSDGFIDTIKPSIMIDNIYPYAIHIWVAEAVNNCRIELIHF